MSGAEVLLSILKKHFHRQRPESFFDTRLPSGYSFPSGHALLSFCCYGLLAALGSAYVRARIRWLIRICATALILAIVQFGDWQHPLLVLAVFAVVQTLEGLVISPKIMGGRVGLHPVTIIIAVMVGTTLLGGLLGGILAIPLTAALRVVMFRYVWKREGAKPRS